MYGFGNQIGKILVDSSLPPLPPGYLYMITETGVQITDEAGNILISENQLDNLWNDYSARVLADGGTVEGETCVRNFLLELIADDLYNSASLVLFPSGVKAGKIFTQKPVEILGTEINADIDFSTPSAWDKDAGWVVADNKATFSGTSGYIRQLSTLTVGVTYRFSFDLYNSDGSNYVQIYSGGGGSSLTTDGHYNIDVTATVDRIMFRGVGNTTNVYIQNVSVKQILTPAADLTFTRASTATRVNESGLIENVAANVARVDYTGGGCGKLLLEPQRTNLVTYSQDFANVYWSKTDITFGADGVSPSGLTDADLIVTGVANSDQINRTITLAATNTVTQSVFIKRVAGADWVDFLMLRNGFTNSVKVWFNISNGTVGGSQQGGTTVLNSAEIESFGNDWYRLIVTTTDTTNNTNFDVRVRTASADSSDTRVNNSSYYLWGAQLEAGTYPTSYIPTTGSTVTRVAEYCYKTDIASLIGQQSGSFVIEYEVSSVGLDEIFMFEKTKLSNIQIRQNANGSITLNVYEANSTIISISTSSGIITDGVSIKIGVRYESGDTKVFINGTEEASSVTSYTFTNTIDEVYLETTPHLSAGESALKYSFFMLFNTALSDAQLEELTTL